MTPEANIKRGAHLDGGRRILLGHGLEDVTVKRRLPWMIIACAMLEAACSRGPIGEEEHGGLAGGGSSSGGSTSGGSSGAGGTSPLDSGQATSTGGGGLGTSDADATIDAGALGAAVFAAGELDSPSNGGTITFQNIGKAGTFPSRRDPATGACNVPSAAGCCRTAFDVTGDELTPWDEDLIMSLRGPLLVRQIVTYQPSPTNAALWQLVAAWDDRAPTSATGLAFTGNQTETRGFTGAIGTECIVDTSTDRLFSCGPGSIPYCPPPGNARKYYGWEGSKMVVLLSTMPYASSGKVAGPCSQTNTGNWYNAPWVGLSHGELIRSGAFGSCQCYAANVNAGSVGDGCGQFNVFETVNDNNSFRNFDVYSTNLTAYSGYVGEGPCGSACNATLFPPTADLISKATSLEASRGVVTGPGVAVGAAFRRPENGYRYFVILLDVATRTVQLAIVHPLKIPGAMGSFLPNFPRVIPRSAVDATLGARLPR
jgi:hypothetical protein